MPRNRSERPGPRSRRVTHPNQGQYEASLIEAGEGLWQVRIGPVDDLGLPMRMTEPGGWEQSLIVYEAVPARIWWSGKWVESPPGTRNAT